MSKKKVKEERVDHAKGNDENAKHRDVPKYRQCPVCYGGRGGVGKRKWTSRINGATVKNCYVCDTCNFDWVVLIRTTKEVDYLDLDIDTNDDLELGTR